MYCHLDVLCPADAACICPLSTPTHLELIHRNAAHAAADVGAGQRQRAAVLAAEGADEGAVWDADTDGPHPGVELLSQRRVGAARQQQRDRPWQQLFHQAGRQVLQGWG